MGSSPELGLQWAVGRCPGFDSCPEFLQGRSQDLAVVAGRKNQLQPGERDFAAQARFALAGHALRGPPIAEAKITTAAAAASQHDPVSAAAQRIFDKRRGQDARAYQADDGGVGSGQRLGIGTTVAAEDDDPGGAFESGKRILELLAPGRA